MTPEEETSVKKEEAPASERRYDSYESAELTGTVFDALEVRLIESDEKLCALYRDVLKKTLEAKKLNAEQAIRAMKEQEQRVRAEQRAQGIQHGQNAQYVDEF